MLARLLQRLGLALTLAAAGWLGWSWRQGLGPWGAFGPVLALLGLNALALGLEQALAAGAHGNDPAPRPGPGLRLRAWAREVRQSSRVFGWEMPFASTRWPDMLPAAPGLAPGGRGVLLVHGYLCNRGFWNAWYPRLQVQGVPFVGVSLEPVFGSIDDYAEQIDAALARLQRATGQAPLVVCHSMGGVVLRAWRRSRLARGESAEAVEARVHHVLTIGTPHRGTWLARFGRQPNAVQMRQDSPWLQALAASESPAWRARFTCVWSACDNVVFPPCCAVLEGAASVQRPGRGHQDLLDDAAVFALALALRASPLSPTEAAAA
ncbi:permease [Sphaerotilus sp.]|uniref:esterase/lipase family protein n=1 Tax=Sphaerotilus sp. TaxID=2093942 RepID=UPI002ACECE0A|nr:permease [Sphaerotilus sp.]MDZ7858908.1 permease [Sphaerotilus sp.]